MLSVEDAARIMAAVQLGQQLPIDTPEAEALAERLRSEMETFPPGVEVEVPGEWGIDDREELLNESLRFVLSESLIRSDRYRIVESAAAVPSITFGGGDHWKGQPRAKDGKWIDSGVDYSKWPQQNSAAMSAKKKIKLFEKLIADGKHDEFMQLVPVINSKQPNSYQKGVAKAWQNLHELVKQNAMTPPKGSVPIPGTAAVAGWTKLGGQLGTEKGGTYIGPDGAKYYVKTPDNPARAHNEVLAFKLYELAGGNVAKSELVQVEGKTGIATKWMGSAQKSDWNAEDKKMAHSDFALHAWLNNWDAVGAGSENPMDNIKKFEGKMVLVDAGGSLEYKGMGGAGKKQFLPHAPEFDSLLNPKVNPTMAKVFGGMTKNELFESSKKLHGVTNDMIDEVVKKYHLGTDAEKQNMASILKQRRDAIVNAGLAHMQDTIAPDMDDDFGDAPVVIVGQQSAKAGEPIPKPPSQVPKPKASGSLPPPPYVQSVANPSAKAKLQALYDAASKGGVEALKNVATNGESKNTYAKKAHAYKQQLLAALQAGALPNPDHVTTSPSPIEPSFAESKAAQTKAENAAAAAAAAAATVDGKVSAKLFSNPPGFAGSKAAINQKHAADMIAFARAGNKAGIQAIDVPDGTKIGEYKKKLLAEIDQIPQKKEAFKKQKAEYEKAVAEAKIAAEKAAAEFKSKYGDFSSASKELAKETKAIKKVGYWSVVHENIPVPKVDGVWNNQIDHEPNFEMHVQGLKAYQSMTPEQQNALDYYTGGSYKSMNKTLVAASGKAKAAGKAKHLADAFKKAIPINEGIMLSRKYTIGEGIDEHDLKPGMVVKTNAVSSTSTDKGFWHGNIQMRILVGPGVKGIPAAGFSTSEHYEPKLKIAKGENPGQMKENEIILPPNQAYAIHSVEIVNGKKIVNCIALPTIL